jgi:hypothetical protein
MIRLVIDTNNLPQNIEKLSAAYTRLRALAEAGLVEVSISHVVSEEWRTQQKLRQIKQAQKGKEAIDVLISNAFVGDEQKAVQLRTTIVELEVMEGSAEERSYELLARLMEELGAIILPIADSHGKKVMEGYFNGDKPFSAIKARKDIPDAFVFEANKGLVEASQDDQVIGVTADKNLRENLASLGMTCHESLDSFVQSPEVAEAVKDIALELKWHEQLENIVQRFINEPGEIEASLSENSFIDAVAGSEVSHPSIPSDNQDAVVSMVDEAKNMDYQWDEADDYGPGVIRVPFTCETEILLYFYVFYADAYGLGPEISVQYTDPDSTHYFDAQAHATAEVTGFAVVYTENWEEGPEHIEPEILVDEISRIELQEHDEVGNALY